MYCVDVPAALPRGLPLPLPEALLANALLARCGLQARNERALWGIAQLYQEQDNKPRAIEAYRDYVMNETLAVSLSGRAVSGVSDAVESEQLEAAEGRTQANGSFLAHVEVGGRAVHATLRRAGA